MRIITTNIKDKDNEDLSQNKINLANKIIKLVSPLLDQVYNEKINTIKKLKEDYLIKKQEVLSEKKVIEKLATDFERRKKVKKLIGNFSQLFSLKVITLHTKNEIVTILNTVDELGNDKIDFYIKESDKMLVRRLNNNTTN